MSDLRKSSIVHGTSGRGSWQVMRFRQVQQMFGNVKHTIRGMPRQTGHTQVKPSNILATQVIAHFRIKLELEYR